MISVRKLLVGVLLGQLTVALALLAASGVGGILSARRTPIEMPTVQFTPTSGTDAHRRARVDAYLARGLCDKAFQWMTEDERETFGGCT